MAPKEQFLYVNWGDVIRIHSTTAKGVILSKGFTQPNVYYQQYTTLEDLILYRQTLFQILPRGPLPKTPTPVPYQTSILFQHLQSGCFLQGSLTAAGLCGFKIVLHDAEGQQLPQNCFFQLYSPRSYQKQGHPVYYDDGLQLYNKETESYVVYEEVECGRVREKQHGSPYADERPIVKRQNEGRSNVISDSGRHCLLRLLRHNSYPFTINKITSHDIVYLKHTKYKEVLCSAINTNQCFLKPMQGDNHYEALWQLHAQGRNLFSARNFINGQLLMHDGVAVHVKTSEDVNSNDLVELIVGDTHLDRGTQFRADDQKRERASERMSVDKSQKHSIEQQHDRQYKYLLSERNEDSGDGFIIIRVPDLVIKSTSLVTSAQQTVYNLVQNISHMQGIAQDQLQRFLQSCEQFLARRREQDEVELSKILVQSRTALMLIEMVCLLFPQMEELKTKVAKEEILLVKAYTMCYRVLEEVAKTQRQYFTKWVRQFIQQLRVAPIVQDCVSAILQNNPKAIKLTIHDKDIHKLIGNFQKEVKEAFKKKKKKIKIKKHVSDEDQASEEEDLVQTQESNSYERYIRLFSILMKCDSCTIRRNQAIILSSLFKKEQYFRFQLHQNQQKSMKSYSDQQQKEILVLLAQNYFLVEDGRQQVIILPKNQYYNQEHEEVYLQFGLFQLRVSHESLFNYMLSYVNLLADACMDKHSQAMAVAEEIVPLRVIVALLFDKSFINRLNLIKSNDMKKKEMKEERMKNSVIGNRSNSLINDLMKKHSGHMQEIIPKTVQTILKESVANSNQFNSLHSKNKSFTQSDILSNNKEFLIPFLRIIRYVYLSNNKFITIRRIRKIFNWNKNNELQIPQTKRVYEGQKQNEQKLHLQKVLQFIIQFFKNSREQITYVVLELFKDTVQLGLWSSKQQLNRIVPLLMKNVVNIKKGSQQSSTCEVLKKEQIAAIDILRLINEMYLDIKVRKVATFFRSMYLGQLDFSPYNYLPQCLHPTAKQESAKEKNSTNDIAYKYYVSEGGDSPPDDDWLLNEYIWYKKVKEIVSQDQNKTVQAGSLLQLCGCSDEHLVCCSLNKLRSMCQEAQSLITHVDHLLILNDGHLALVYRFITSMRNKLAAMQQQDFFTSTEYPISKPYDHLEVKHQRRAGIIQNLFFLSRTMLAGANLNNVQALLQVQPHHLQEKCYTERDTNELLFQELNLAEGIYLPLINYLKNALQQLYGNEEKKQSQLDMSGSVVSGTNSLTKSVNLYQLQEQMGHSPLLGKSSLTPTLEDTLIPTHRPLIITVFRYLTLLCFNNPKAKEILARDIKIVLMALPYKLNAAALLSEICLGNKILLNKESTIELIVEQAINACLLLGNEENKRQQTNFQQNLAPVMENESATFNLNCQTYNTTLRRLHLGKEQAKILYSLRSILVLHGQGHRRNQQLLLTKLQQHKQLILSQSSLTPSFEELKAMRNHFFHVYPTYPFTLLQPQIYMVAHFQLFASLIESDSQINVGKLTNQHSYVTLLQMWELRGLQSRRALRSYVNRLYYMHCDRDTFLFEKFIEYQFDHLNIELEYVGHLHDPHDKRTHYDMKIKKGVRFTFVQSEISLALIEICITVDKMFSKGQFVALLRNRLKKERKDDADAKVIHKKLIRLLKAFGVINKLYYKSKSIQSTLKGIKNKLNPIYEQFDKRYLEKEATPQRTKSRINCKGEDKLAKIEQMIKEMKDVSESEYHNNDLAESIAIDKQNIQRIQQSEQQQYGHHGEDKNKLQQSIGNISKGFMYDQNRSFFRNVVQMIRHLKTEQNYHRIMNEQSKIKNQGQLSEADIRKKFIDEIYKVEDVKVKGVIPPHIPHKQPIEQKIIKVLFRKQLPSEDYTAQLNEKLSLIKQMLKERPIFKKLIQEQFIQFVTLFANYSAQGQSNEVSRRKILTNCFKILSNGVIGNDEKIFFTKLVRYYITEAVECEQQYKLPVDKWTSSYYTDECGSCLPTDENRSQLVRRQHQIQQCGGSTFILSLLSTNTSQDTTLLNETLLLAIAYLYNGNTHCQSSMLRQFTKEIGHEIESYIQNMGQFIIDTHKQFQIKGSDVIDAYDYYDPENGLVKMFQQRGDQRELEVLNEFKDGFKRIFRFLQLFCENNNVECKKYIGGANNTINFISEATLFLKKIFKIMSNTVVEIPSSVLDFINEVTQIPCIENQKSLMKSTFFQDLSYMVSFFKDSQNLASRKFSKDQPQYSSLISIYDKGVALALSNFQGNELQIYGQFLNKCQPRFLIQTLHHSLLKIIQQPIDEMSKQVLLQRIQKKISVASKKSTFNENIDQLLKILYIMKKIQDYGAICQKRGLANKQNPQLQYTQRALQASVFRKNFTRSPLTRAVQVRDVIPLFNMIYSIEVSCFNGNAITVQNVYFPRHPIFAHLAASTKAQVMQGVVRETRRDKLLTLFDYYEDVKEQLKWHFTMKHNEVFSVTSGVVDEVKYIARSVSYIICILMLVIMHVEHEPTEAHYTVLKYWHQLLISVLSIAQLALTALYLGLWLLMRLPLCRIKFRNKQSEEAEGELPVEDEVLEFNSNASNIRILLDFLTKFRIAGEEMLEGCKQFITNRLSSVLSFTRKSTSYQRGQQLLSSIYNDVSSLFMYEADFISIALFTIIALMGYIMGTKWYTLHIFDYFTSILLLGNVFKAILKNLKQLLLLSGFACCFILVFNVLSLNTYANIIYAEGNESCSSVVECVLTVYTSGAIGQDMDQLYVGRFSFDTLYVVFMQMLFLNLVSGIMIDTFSELRESDESKAEDRMNVCYVCAEEKSSMEKRGTTFKKHIDKHYLWYYIFYRYCLENKDSTDYTGLEYVISEQISKLQVDWFPDNSQKDLSGDYEQDMKGLTEDINTVYSIKQEIHSIESKISENYKAIETTQ